MPIATINLFTGETLRVLDLGHMQLARGRDDILGIVGLVRAYGDAPPASFSFVLEHQQRGFGLGISVGLESDVDQLIPRLGIVTTGIRVQLA